MLTDLGRTFDENRDRFVRDWSEFLSFPSISADPEHTDDCLACAAWLAGRLRAIGFETELLETTRHPVVFATREVGQDRPTVLLYGHYDVQPVDPLEEWVSPPFEPTLRLGRMYARGAQDNKGQVMYLVHALETLHAKGLLNANIKVLIEGDEECSSRGVTELLTRWADRLKADVLMVCDTDMISIDRPTIIMGLRGIVHLTAVLTGPGHDLHSGMHGGLAFNPAREAAALVASLYGPGGRVAVDGFYDGVEKPSRKEHERANEVPFDPARYEEETGLTAVTGEEGFTPAERLGFRPCLEVNGIHSGYGGGGVKTIIPSKAVLKLSARLVPGQDPDRCLAAIVHHLERHVPAGIRLHIPDRGVGGPGFRLSLDSPRVAQAQRVLERLGVGQTAFLWEGASIPIVSALWKVSGAEPLLIGFGLPQDRIHAPNESFSVDQFRLGYLYAGLMLQELGAG